MTTLTSYPVYKNSGVEWLGNVPEHWDIRRLRSVAELTASNVDKVPSPDEQPVRLCNYTDVYKHHLIADDMQFMAGTATPEEIKNFSLHGGEVLFTKDSETFDDIGIPAVVGEGLENVIVGYHLMMARPQKELLGHYLAWFFTPQIYRWQFEVSAKGVTRFGMPQSGFKDALVPLPPLDEQREIADFLDGMDARITQFIAARRKMIVLLEEQKQAVINQAVTCGLDPGVPMKDSGVDWLGEIPAQWEVRKTAQCFSKSGSGTTPASGDRSFYEDGTTPWVVTGDLNDAVITTPNKFVTQAALDGHTALRIYPAGSLIIAMYGATIGKTGILGFDATVNQACFVLAPSNVMLTRFAQRQFIAFKQHLINFGVGGGQPNVNSQIIRSFRIAVPPIEEQLAVMEHIDHELSEIEAFTTRQRREIELMQEYWTRLISDVVTGKLDVRGVELPQVEAVVDEEIASVMEDEEIVEPLDEVVEP